MGLTNPEMYLFEDDALAVIDEFIEYGLPAWKRCSGTVGRAVRCNCGLTADRVAYPRDERFCEGPHCRKCKVGTELVKVGFARQEDLVELTAAGAGERHRRRLELLVAAVDGGGEWGCRRGAGGG